MEAAAESWEEGVKVSVCRLLSGAVSGVHQEMVSLESDPQLGVDFPSYEMFI